MEGRIDVTVENRGAGRAEADGKRHPNTCPSCHSHYRDDELEHTLRVCPQCGHHFPVRARERIAQLADRGTFSEEDADLRSADPLGFFDVKAYTERIAEAELATGLGDALVAGADVLRDAPAPLVTIMPHPPTAGVLASFASLGDVIVAEPGALLSFTGPRVVQQTTREKLPEDFALAESNSRFGHVDAIVSRPELRPYVGRLLALFGAGPN